jgi:hypothetical protein
MVISRQWLAAFTHLASSELPFRKIRQGENSYFFSYRVKLLGEKYYACYSFRDEEYPTNSIDSRQEKSDPHGAGCLAEKVK